jgi:mono/diheme cytochrome c family protein
MIRNRVSVTNLTNEMVKVATRSEDNTLCLACHAWSPPFDLVSKADLQGAAGGGRRWAIQVAVTLHMREQGMLTSFDEYDPAGPSRIGSCIECHMPRLGVSAGTETDPSGYLRGDLRSHTFDAVWPSASEAATGGLRGMTNSCTGCHDPFVGPVADLGGRVIWEWGRNRAADPDRFHADTPLPGQDGLLNPLGAAGGVRCIACHTSRGFEEIQVGGDLTGLSADQARVDEILADSVERDIGITCSACHGISALAVRQPRLPAGGSLREVPQRRRRRLPGLRLQRGDPGGPDPGRPEGDRRCALSGGGLQPEPPRLPRRL